MQNGVINNVYLVFGLMFRLNYLSFGYEIQFMAYEIYKNTLPHRRQNINKDLKLNKKYLGIVDLVVKVADPLLMREINKYNVLETIRRHGRISRVEISERTLLSGTTVSAITSALLEEGLIQAIHTRPGGDTQRGRPRVLLDLIPDAAYVVGIMITERRTTTKLANFKGEAIASVQVPVSVAQWEPEVIVDLIEGSVREIISQGGVDKAKIKGIGIGIPGIVDPASGRSHSSPVFGARDMPIGKLLEERMQIKVRIEKPANLVALAESWFGVAQRDNTFAVVAIDDSVELSLFFAGELHRGASALGSTFGHINVGNEGRVCECGQLDCLQTYVSPQALVKQWKLKRKEPSELSKLSGKEALSTLWASAQSGDVDAKEILQIHARKLGVGVSHIINLINPAKIIIGIQDAAYRDVIEHEFRTSVEQNSFAAHYSSTEMIFHIFDEQMWASGAAALMLKDIYSAPWTT